MYFNISRIRIFSIYLFIYFFPFSRKKIDIQPGQNVLKFIQDCFESKVLFDVLLDLLIKE